MARKGVGGEERKRNVASNKRRQGREEKAARKVRQQGTKVRGGNEERGAAMKRGERQ